MKAPVRKIIDQSNVDGPGNRTAVFLQGCNIRCAYCHNPETQMLPTDGDEGEWTWMEPLEVAERVERNMPFIRGVTVSGGECMLYTEWVTELFRLLRPHGLTCLIDTNGTIDFSRHPDLLAVTDGVMLDIKAWDHGVFHRLTGGTTACCDNIKKNLLLLARQDKLEEIRLVSLQGAVDVEDCIRGVRAMVGRTHRLRLIPFRPQGVVGPLATMPMPTAEQMAIWQEL